MANCLAGLRFLNRIAGLTAPDRTLAALARSRVHGTDHRAPFAAGRAQGVVSPASSESSIAKQRSAPLVANSGGRPSLAQRTRRFFDDRVAPVQLVLMLSISARCSLII